MKNHYTFYTMVTVLALLLPLPVTGECKEVIIDNRLIDLQPPRQELEQKIVESGKTSTIKFSLSYSSYTEEEYLPEIDDYLFTWREDTREAGISYQWGWHKSISGGWQQGTIKQENDLLGDIDFALKRQGPYLQAAFPLYGKWVAKARIADEEFTNDNNNGYYQLADPEHIITGNLVVSYVLEDFWLDLSYNRHRDTEPDFDTLLNRSKLDIKTKKLSGLSLGRLLSPEWTASGSIFFEQYETVIEDQFNFNGLVSYSPRQLKTIDISLGAGYYTEEQETLVNLSVGHLWQWRQLSGNINYQMEYSHNDQAWLNQAGLLCNWPITRNISLSIQSIYGREFGDDQDTFFSFNAGVNLAIF